MKIDSCLGVVGLLYGHCTKSCWPSDNWYVTSLTISCKMRMANLNIGVCGGFWNQNFMVNWFTNLRNLKQGMFLFVFFLFSSEKIITRKRRIGYNLNVMRQSASLVINPIVVDNYSAFFNCTPVGRASDSKMAPT